MVKLVCVVAVLGTIALPAISSAQALGVNPDGLEVAVGDSFVMEYWIGGLGDHVAPSLGSFDVKMDFDESLVSYSSSTVGDMLGDVGAGQATATTTLVADGVEVTETSNLTPAELIALQPWNFTMFRVRFIAMAEGNAVFGPSFTTVLDEHGDPVNLEVGIQAIVHIHARTAVPTLSAWGISALIGGLLIAGLAILRRSGLAT